MRQYLIAIEFSNKPAQRAYFSPSASLRVDESDADAAALAAQEWHDDATACTPVLDNHGKPVTRTR